MQKLNQTATKIFCRLLQKLNGQQHCKIIVPEFMPLSIERLQENIETTLGQGILFSLCHYYELNGDLMRDPEMCFIVVDKRTNPKDFLAVAVYPQLYQLDSLGIYEESIRIENATVTGYIKTWQSGHCSFANQWMKNIAQQGFLNQQKMKTANRLSIVYKAIRLQYKGAVPLIRNGDEYITFSVDAVLIHEKTGIALTERDQIECRFSVLQLDRIVTILVKSGYKVAVVDRL